MDSALSKPPIPAAMSAIMASFFMFSSFSLIVLYLIPERFPIPSSQFVIRRVEQKLMLSIEVIIESHLGDIHDDLIIIVVSDRDLKGNPEMTAEPQFDARADTRCPTIFRLAGGGFGIGDQVVVIVVGSYIYLEEYTLSR
jgi:hypothetical protein